MNIPYRLRNASSSSTSTTTTTPSAGSVLAQVVDENRRSALHFVAALGNADAVRLLVAAGADPDAQDKDGFTPLHMASGYMRIQAIAALLEAGADPELRDSSGRDVVSLVDSLRASSPLSPATVQRRMALEGVAPMPSVTSSGYGRARVKGGARVFRLGG